MERELIQKAMAQAHNNKSEVARHLGLARGQLYSRLKRLARYGYLVVFGTVFAEQIGLPFPSEPFLLAAGAFAGNGHLNLLIALPLGAAASLIGDTAWYWVGRLRGPRVLGWLRRLSLEPDICVRRTQGIFEKYGASSLVVARGSRDRGQPGMARVPRASHARDQHARRLRGGRRPSPLAARRDGGGGRRGGGHQLGARVPGGQLTM